MSHVWAVTGSEAVLGPGDWYFGHDAVRVRTLLGSCVAVTLWHPRTGLAGMCHYMTPSRRIAAPEDAPLDGRYADEAFLLLLGEIAASGTLPWEYEVKMFGGGNQFPGERAPVMDVAALNVHAGFCLAEHHGLHLVAHDVGRAVHRTVVLDPATGQVWVRHGESGVDRGEEQPRPDGLASVGGPR